MTDQEINIAIAEACGWKSRPDHFYVDNLAWTQDEGANWCATYDLPDYCQDLNAMHEAECHIIVRQMGRYLSAISNIVQSQAVYHPLDLQWWSVRATARQRAEAFLRTIDKWKE